MVLETNQMCPGNDSGRLFKFFGLAAPSIGHSFGKNTIYRTGAFPEQVAIELSYFRILIYGSILGLARQAIAGFFIGLGRTRIVMLANFVGMLVNIPAIGL